MKNLIFLVLCITSYAWSANLGEPVAVQANAKTMIDYTLAGMTLEIEVDAACNVTLSAYVSVVHPLPKKMQSLSFGANVGFTLDINPKAVITSARLVTPSVTLASATVLNATVKAGCLNLNEASKTYSQIDIESYDVNRKFTVNLPEAATYVFIAYQVDAPLPTFYGQPRLCEANKKYSFQYGATVLEIQVDRQSTIVLDFFKSVTVQLPVNHSALAFDGQVGFNLTVSNSAVVVSANLTTPPVDTSLLSLLTAGAKAGCLQFDASNSMYSSIQASMDPIAKTIAVELPDADVYVFVAIKAEAPIPTFYGRPRVCDGNKKYSIQYGATLLEIQLEKQATVTLNTHNAVDTNLPPNMKALSFGLELGFELTIQPPEVAIVSAKLTTPPLTTESLSQLTGSVKAGCVRLDSTTSTYSQVAIDSLDSNNRIAVQLPTAGVYILVAVNGSVALPAVFSQSIQVKANVKAILQFSVVGPTLEITVDRDATLTMSMVATLSASLPQGMKQLSFGTAIGYSFTLAPANTVVLQAQLRTPPVSLTAQSLISGDVDVACLHFETENDNYQQLEVESYNFDKSITVVVPESGYYVFVVVNASFPILSDYGNRRPVRGGEKQVFRYPDGLELEFLSQSDNNLTVVYYKSNPKPTNPDGKISMDAFFDFEVDVNTGITAEISFSYDDAVVTAKGVVESSLRIARYDENTKKWEFMSDGTVDTSANICRQKTTHFSTWAVYADPSNDTVGDGGDGDVSNATKVVFALSSLFAAIFLVL